ncbi:hypothetical protein IAI52_19100 [Pseudomonas lurida]|uniref:hypothetical protein n=1 Tax=Pseudomonas lurida TaxID=244566 RepID=UPI001656E123|nr:hypothetical protein [Pseudomonas lurida]MBC8982359.1 hypothetical protein [Pseudomonas lurida]
MTDYYELLEDALNSLRRNATAAASLDPDKAKWLLKKHEVWGNSSAGVALGYNLEAEKALKYLKKGRVISSERGDITTLSSKFGRGGEEQGKVLQLKHTLCKTPSAVDTALGKAILQISGHTKEEPEDDDRLVIEMVISNMENKWPLSNKLGKLWVDWEYTYPLSAFESVVKLKLVKLSRGGQIWPVKWEGKAGKLAQGINKGIYHERPDETAEFENLFKVRKSGVTDIRLAQSAQPTASNDTSRKLRDRVQKVDPEGFILLPGRIDFVTSSHMLIKIVYSTGRMFKLSEGNEVALEKIAIAVKWTEGVGLQAHVVKIKPI